MTVDASSPTRTIPGVAPLTVPGLRAAPSGRIDRSIQNNRGISMATF